MFAKNSRYAGLPTVPARGANLAASTSLVKLRAPPDTAGAAIAVRAHDQLDAMSETHFGGDPTRYWHIADANSEIEAAELTRSAGRFIDVPQN